MLQEFTKAASTGKKCGVNVKSDNTFLFLFDFNQISIVKYFDLHPELNQVLMSPWTIVTYSFFHLDFFHIFWNMLILYLVSDYSEKMKLIYNERSLGIFLKETRDLVQLKRSALVDTHAFLFDNDFLNKIKVN